MIGRGHSIHDPKTVFGAGASVISIPGFLATFPDCCNIGLKLKCADVKTSDCIAVLLTSAPIGHVLDPILIYKSIVVIGIDSNAFESFHPNPSQMIWLSNHSNPLMFLSTLLRSSPECGWTL
jgi:hypothetical protein